MGTMVRGIYPVGTIALPALLQDLLPSLAKAENFFSIRRNLRLETAIESGADCLRQHDLSRMPVNVAAT